MKCSRSRAGLGLTSMFLILALGALTPTAAAQSDPAVQEA
jgi:hypothetical protein